MPYNLSGKNVLVTGGSRGLGAAICNAFAARGANIALNYYSNESAASELANSLSSTHSVRVELVRADAARMTDVARMVAEAHEKLHGLDVIVGNSGWTKFAAFADLDSLTEEDWDRCWAANVKSPLALMKAANPIFNANPEGGVLLLTSSIASLNPAGSSMAYSVTKAAQNHLAKCLAKTQGPKTRVNSVLPGLLLTEWGLKYGPEAIHQLTKVDPVLKQETELDQCAEMYVLLAQNTSTTGQTVAVDSGLALGRTQ